jgi:hypothetical protein
MRRLLLSLLPIPALAAVVALSCGRTRSDEPATRVIPPAAPYLAPSASAAPATPAAPAAAPSAADEAPSPAEVKAFERPVAK